MEFYIYSCQDLILNGDNIVKVLSNNFYKMELNKGEFIAINSCISQGFIMIDYDILCKQNHNQILFHSINNNSILCEIKPFTSCENIKYFSIGKSYIKLKQDIDNVYIFFNNNYYGTIRAHSPNIKFEKITRSNQEYGLVYILGNKKYILFFKEDEVVFCQPFIDFEILKNNIKLYCHNLNMFNVGSLIDYNFETNKIVYKSINDRNIEHNQINPQFDIIYFLEAIKCKRFKYAYNKLSYELRCELSVDVLSAYFSNIDDYIFIEQQNAFITLKNNKVIGVYHFVVKNNFIEQIY